MKVTQDYINEQYHQVYILFNAAEVNKIFAEVEEHSDLAGKRTQKAKNILLDLVKNKIENDIIEEELMRLDVVPISFRKYRYLTKLAKGNPLLVIAQFCILPANLQLKFPLKIPSVIFNIPYEKQVIREFTHQILLANNQFYYEDVEVATKESYVKYDLSYSKDDFVINEIIDQVNSSDEYDNPDEYSFVDCRVGDTVLLDEEDGVVVKAKVKEIKNRVVHRLTNEIVTELNFLGCKTVTEFRRKIKDVFTFSTTNVMLLNYLADFIIKNGNITFDGPVLEHFVNEDIPPEDIKRELVKEYIIWIINYNSSDDDVIYMDKIVEEYEFDKMLFNNPYRVDRYQEFISRRVFEVKVLEYCLEQNILDIEL